MTIEKKPALRINTRNLSLKQALRKLAAKSVIHREQLEAHLKIGSEVYEIRIMTTSSRVYGRLLKEHLPEVSALYPSLRSDCLWLFRMLSQVSELEFCEICGVTSLEKLGTGHPSVIRRIFRKGLVELNPGQRKYYRAIGSGRITVE